MAKKKKILLIALGSVVVVFVALIVLAKVLITPERVREAVVPLAEDALDRKVELGAIDVSLLSGISLQDMAIRKKDGEGNFVSADKVVLRYSLLALLMFKVEVDEVTLVKPQIEIVRNADGTFNFSDLAGESQQEQAEREDNSSPGDTGIDLHISQIGISDGQLLFIDQAVKGQPERHLVSAFNFAAKDVSTSKDFPVDLSADWNGNGLGLNGRVNIAETSADLSISFNKISLGVAGGMKNDKPRAVVTLSKISLADLFGSIPKEYDPGLSELGLQGSMQFKVDLDDDVVKTSGMAVEVNGQTVRLDLNAANLYGNVIKASFKAESDSLIIDKMLPASSANDNQNAPPKPQAAAHEIGPFLIPLDLTGKVSIGKAVYNGIPVNNLLLDITLQKNVLHIKRLNAAIAGGRFSHNGMVDLNVKGLNYSMELDLKGIQGSDMVKIAKPELAQSINGILGGEFMLAGSGTLPETAKKKLSGKGTLRLADGKLQSIPALNATAALLGVGELREVVLDDGSVQFTIKDGQVNINSKIAGPTTRMTTSGQVSLDGRLDLRSQLALSPELGGRLHAQGKIARYLGDDKGWTTVPLRIKGHYDSPDVGLDSKGLKKQAEKAVKKEVEKKLEKELQRGLQKLFGN